MKESTVKKDLREISTEIQDRLDKVNELINQRESETQEAVDLSHKTSDEMLAMLNATSRSDTMTAANTEMVKLIKSQQQKTEECLMRKLDNIKVQ